MRQKLKKAEGNGKGNGAGKGIQFTYEQFKNIIFEKMSTVTSSSISAQIYEITLMEIFDIFDVDDS